MRPLQTPPFMVKNKEGQSLRLFGALIYVKASSQQTGGGFNLFEVFCPADFTTPLHIHYAEDVTVYVLEGRLTFFCGSEKQTADAGSYFYQPRGTPHGFRVEGGTPARILYMSIPAGLDQFVIERQPPTSESGMERHAARYKIEILEPLPE